MGKKRWNYFMSSNKSRIVCEEMKTTGKTENSLSSQEMRIHH